MTQTGPWRRTPFILRWIGFPEYRRSIYADWRIGGGWDGWEYTEALPSVDAALAAPSASAQGGNAA